MSKLGCVLSLAGAIGLTMTASSGVVYAGVMFTSGNHPQPGEENIMFETTQTGMTITGDTDKSNTFVQFTSTESLSTGGLGQAFFMATTGTITNATFSVPSHTFDDFIFDPHNGSGAAVVTAVANDGSFTDDITLGNGQNFLTITTNGGETLSSVEISAPGGFDTYDQPRVSGISGVTILPEPPSLALLGLSLMGVGLLSRLRRKTKPI